MGIRQIILASVDRMANLGASSYWTDRESHHFQGSPQSRSDIFAGMVPLAEIQALAAQSLVPRLFKQVPSFQLEPPTMPTHDDLTEFLRANEITHFTGMEIARLTLPPERLWANIIPTLQVLERLRARLNAQAPGAYIIITSGYRTTDHNTRVGGSKFSQHIQFRALDFMPMRGTNLISTFDTLEDIEKEEPLTKYLGIGKYASFLHVDCRGLFKASIKGARFGSGEAD